MIVPAPAAGLGSVESRPSVSGVARRWDALTIATIVIAGILGVTWTFLMPPFQFNDEHAHFARSYQIAQGQFIGRADSRLPSGILAWLARYPERAPYKSASRPSLSELLKSDSENSTPLQSVSDVRGLEFFGHGILSAQVYWTGCYIPASLGILSARLLRLPPVTMLYAARLMNLFVFLAALALALTLAPGFRTLLTAVALMPMTLQQAVAVSADSVTIASALVGFAAILYTREHPVSRRYLATVLAFVPFWVLCKNSLWAVPLTLLVPESQFRSRQRRAAYFCVAVMAAIAALLAWRAMTSDAFVHYSAAELSKGLDLYGNARLVATHPFRVLHDLMTLPSSLFNFVQMTSRFVGTFGWEFHPFPFFFLYLEILVLVAFLEPISKPLTLGERIAFGFVFAAALVQTYAMLFAIDGTFSDGHYGFRYAGVQGRYLIPFCLAGFLVLKQRWASAPGRILAPAVLVASTSYAILCLSIVSAFYYQ